VDIHVFWEGPFNINDLYDQNKLNDDSKDYGIYQVYGFHPLYGQSVLLYIGKADSQTFNTRLKQEGWEYEVDNKNIQFYVGRLANEGIITDSNWSKFIDQAEKLLIHAHKPAYNTSNTRALPFGYIKDVHVFNWDSSRSLFPEVSWGRYTKKFDHITEDHIITA